MDVRRSLIGLAASWSEGIRLYLDDGPASGRMMGYAYQNKAKGRGMVGRWIDRRFLNYRGWEGVRQRRRCLEKLLLRTIDSAQTQTSLPIRILDVAGGTADYLISVVAQLPPETVRATCIDLSQTAVEEGQRRANETGNDTIRFEVGDALKAHTLAGLLPNADIVICSGLYELLTEDSAVQASVQMISALLPTRGLFIVSHQTAQPRLGRVGNVFHKSSATRLKMKMRPAEAIANLLTSNGFKIEETHSAAGLYAIFLSRRAERY